MDFTILSSLHKVVPFQLCQRSKKHTQKFQKIQTFFLLILLSLFSLYFLTSNSINFIWVFAFFALIIISITITLPHSSIPLSKPPQTHVFLNKTTQNSKNPVIWSIGSDQKSEKVEKSGFLVKIFDNGDIYEGEVHNGNYSGKGVLVYHHHMCGCTQQVPIDSGCRFHGFQNRKSHDMCGKYEGDWVNGKYEGYGIEMWLSGSNYRGQYRNGLRNGFGVYKFHNGDVYEGEWFNGFCHGCGVVASSDGSVYVGLFKLGVKHGLGHFHFRNGDVYAGEYFADKMHGFGVYNFVNGHQYEGSWHEGERRGFGVYSFKNGEARSGYWQNGFLQNISDPIIGQSSSFRASDVVQKARDAAQRSHSVTVADDRLREAVSAANRTANAARVAAVKAVQKRFFEEISSGRLVSDV